MPDTTSRAPTWADFEEQPDTEFEPRPPAQELAIVLRRFRAELDEAGRAGAESRVQALRALAEQAVLAIELETLLERHSRDFDRASLERVHRALGAVKDRMLSHVAACGLEIVRLEGADARDIVEIVDIDHWRYEDLTSSAVVIAELEAAVCLDGTLLRRGRVVMGGLGDVPRPSPAGGMPTPRDGEPRAGRLTPQEPAAPQIVCPVSGCRTRNAAGADVCLGCLTPLAGFARLSLYPGRLFNQGLHAARRGYGALARERFAAALLWAPDDVRARNAHALACLDVGDVRAARRAWEEVLARLPTEELALRGLAATRAGRAPSG